VLKADSLYIYETMSDTLKEKKDLLRKETLRRRDELSPEERQVKSRIIKARLFNLPDIVSAQNIFFYVSFRSEVQTHEMIRAALAGGKTVTVPAIDMKQRRLVPSRIESFDDDLALGTLGILEPRPEKLRPVPAHQVDVVITPGAVFCEKGWRLGYGGGFYDRFLKESEKKSYALAFELQIVQDVPYDLRYDAGVDYIVTENRVICCK
jgi:5-formyltetrahydrofolate cyclo-ligase